MSSVRVRAYAKINLTLEVLGRRDDGYHDLRTVMQTVSLADELTANAGLDGRKSVSQRGFAQTVSNTTIGTPPPREGNLAWTAQTAFLARTAQVGAIPANCGISLTKRIPVAAGLGGGSSDAAAVLRAMNGLSDGPLSVHELKGTAASLGSDAPFFLRGGTQLAEGRGDALTPLPDLPETWFVLVPRADASERKTARLYSLLRPDHFSDGSHTEALIEAIHAGEPLKPALLCNTFERVEAMAFPELAPVRRAVVRVCGHALLCGAGPSLFALAPDETIARAWVAALAPEVRALAVRTVSAAEASALEYQPAPFA